MQAKFGLSLSNRAVLFGWTTLDDLLDVAQMAERLGYFHSVWVGDNLLSKPRAEAIVTLLGIAARTYQVKLGTICLASLPLRDPILLAIRPPWNPACRKAAPFWPFVTVGQPWMDRHSPMSWR